MSFKHDFVLAELIVKCWLNSRGDHSLHECGIIHCTHNCKTNINICSMILFHKNRLSYNRNRKQKSYNSSHKYPSSILLSSFQAAGMNSCLIIKHVVHLTYFNNCFSPYMTKNLCVQIFFTITSIFAL